MDLVIGILPIDGTSKNGKEFHFHEVSVLTSEASPRQVGQRAIVYTLFDDDELANTIAYKLQEAIKEGVSGLSVKKIKSHYSNGKRYLDYVDFSN